MRNFGLVLLAGMVVHISVSAQNPPTAAPTPQTARQALIEMFMGKGADDLSKHLPDEARRTLIHPGETPDTSVVLRIASVGREFAAQGQHTETFDAGPNILVTDQSDGHQRIEIAVEHDSVLGEEEEIELSVHVYKDGQPQSLPVVPRLIFTMKSEKDIWRLTEITIAGHIPLTDPDYLNAIRKQQDEAHEEMAQMRTTMIAAAETNYAAKHPDRGYACSLTDLFARDPSPQDPSPQDPSTQDPSAAQAAPAFFDPGQGNAEYNGYRFALSGCEGNPASRYRLTAVPIDSESSAKTFCSDESGSVKSVAAESGSSCFTQGQAVNPAAPASTPVEE